MRGLRLSEPGDDLNFFLQLHGPLEIVTNYLLTHLLINLLTYFLTQLLTYSLTHLLTYWLTYLLTYSLIT
jgi:hypothetical protein